MSETTNISINLLALLTVYREKVMAAASAQKPLAMMLHDWTELEMQIQGTELDDQFMQIYSLVTAVSVDLNNVVLAQSKVICRLLMRILCSGEWNINAT